MDKALEALDRLGANIYDKGCIAARDLATIRAYIESLTTRCEKAEADARRYQALRDIEFWATMGRQHVILGNFGDDLDREIDIAIAATRQLDTPK